MVNWNVKKSYSARAGAEKVGKAKSQGSNQT